MKFLIVEDDPDTSESLTKFLEMNGHKGEGVKNPAEALVRIHQACITTEPFDLLVVDYYMPGINGVDLIRRIRQENICDHIPVMLLTAAGGYILDSIEEDLKELQPAKLFGKPVSPKVLLEQAERMVSSNS
jgi:CheY-like chemotaxis protein